MSAWLDIIGIGEDGVEGLSRDAVAVLENAEIIIGGDRHHRLADKIQARRIAWPSPFDAMIDTIKSFKGRKIAILVTGDPLWYSVGARITKAIPPEEIRFHPQLSAFQWAAVRMGWSFADLETVTVHGRPVEQIIPHLAPDVRLICLTKDRTTPEAIANILTERGLGKSRMTVLAALGGAEEKHFSGEAGEWAHQVPDFHTLTIECIAGENAQWYSRQGGLPDDAFVHDGQITKRVVRAATLSALMPYPDAVLLDIGAGCGSIGIEWMRAARGAIAHAIEPVEARREMIYENKMRLGTPRLSIVKGEAPGALASLPRPDAVFIGGGLTDAGVFDAAWGALRPGGRLVANAVTLESETRLFSLFEAHGGTLDRIAASSMISVGNYHGMRPFMQVTQWAVTKPMEAS